MAFKDRYDDAVVALKWPERFRLYPGRESNLQLKGLGDLTDATFECQVRQDSSSATALLEATTVTSSSDGGTVSINFDDEDTQALINKGARLYAVLDALIAGERYQFYEGHVRCEPYGTGLPVEVTVIEFEDMKAQLESIRDACEAAKVAAEAVSISGVPDGDKGDVDVVSGVWRIKHGAVDYSQIANTPAPVVPTVVVDDLLTNQTSHALSAAQGVLLKSYIDALNTLLSSNDLTLDELQEIVDFIKINRATLDTLGIANIAGLQTALDAKATATQGMKADTAIQPNDNLSQLNNDTGYIDSSQLAIDQTGNITTTGSINLPPNKFIKSNWDLVLQTSRKITYFQSQAGSAHTASIGINTNSGSYFLFSTNNKGPFKIGAQDRLNDNDCGEIDLSGVNAFGSATSNIVGGDLRNIAGDGAELSLGVANGGVHRVGGGKGYGAGQNGPLMIMNNRTSPYPDSLMEASSMTYHVNESTNELVFQVKYSDGITVRTGSINLT